MLLILIHLVAIPALAALGFIVACLLHAASYADDALEREWTEKLLEQLEHLIPEEVDA